MPLKKSTRTKAPRSAKKPVRPATPTPTPALAQPETSTGSSRMMGVGAMLLVFCVTAAAMLLAARESSTPAGAAVADAQLEAVVAQTEPPKAAPRQTPMPRPAANTTAAAETKSPVLKLSAVTITGCLERGNDTFRLTDTDGSDAPKTRSWKSGFLKKGPASIEVVDTARKLRMASHVGERVSVTGLLEDRQMQVRSLRRIAPACE
jgi:hypothetical protein